MPRSISGSKTSGASDREKDILKLVSAPENPPAKGARRIGIHTSTGGGVENAAERAWRLGCNCLQIFSSSPRQWRPASLAPGQCETMKALCAKYDLAPLVVHANYLINVASANAEFHRKSVEAFRAEIERALALGAEYLVLHPGSYRGLTREEGLARAATAIEASARGLDLAGEGLTILIENTAGAEFSLGSGFEQVAELIERLRAHVPVAACIDTCHSYVSGHDLAGEDGYEAAMKKLAATVSFKNIPVWHCNDAKAALGSKLDRHENIGKGTMGLEAFRRLLNDPRTKDAAFIAETPIDEPLDDLRNVNTLRGLVARAKTKLKKQKGTGNETS